MSGADKCVFNLFDLIVLVSDYTIRYTGWCSGFIITSITVRLKHICKSYCVWLPKWSVCPNDSKIYDLVRSVLGILQPAGWLSLSGLCEVNCKLKHEWKSIFAVYAFILKGCVCQGATSDAQKKKKESLIVNVLNNPDCFKEVKA